MENPVITHRVFCFSASFRSISRFSPHGEQIARHAATVPGGDQASFL